MFKVEIQNIVIPQIIYSSNTELQGMRVSTSKITNDLLSFILLSSMFKHDYNSILIPVNARLLPRLCTNQFFYTIDVRKTQIFINHYRFQSIYHIYMQPSQ